MYFVLISNTVTHMNKGSVEPAVIFKNLTEFCDQKV